MKTYSFFSRITRAAAALAIVAMLALSVPIARNFGAPQKAVVSASHGAQVADGSESNGGKGGKGSAKRSGIA